MFPLRRAVWNVCLAGIGAGTSYRTRAALCTLAWWPLWTGDCIKAIRPRCRLRPATPMRAQWHAFALPIILLGALLGGYVQPVRAQPCGTIPTGIVSAPGDFPQTLNPGDTCVVADGTNVTVSDGFITPTNGTPIPEVVIAPTTAAGISIVTGTINGAAAGSVVRTDMLGTSTEHPTAVEVTVTGSAAVPINLTSHGPGVFWLFGPNSTLTVTGPNVTLAADGNVGGQEATVVTVQAEATATLTNIRLQLGGNPGMTAGEGQRLPVPDKMALCVGGCGLTGGGTGAQISGFNVGANATLENVVIDVTSDTSAGIWVSRNPGPAQVVPANFLTVNDSTITMHGPNSLGIQSDINGQPVLNGVTITTMGTNSNGAFASTFAGDTIQQTEPDAQFARGTITINGGLITTEGANSTAAMAAGGFSGTVPGGLDATVTLSGTTIMTEGDHSNGLVACFCQTVDNLNGGDIIATNTNVTTIGPSSIGAYAEDHHPAGTDGLIMLTNGSITIEGPDSAGYFANNGVISATGTTVLTMASNSPGGIVSNGGALSISGGSVTTTGAGSFGFLIEPAPDVAARQGFVTNFKYPGIPGVANVNPTGVNELTINAATVSSAADAFHVENAIAEITVSGSTITGGNGVLLNTLSSGTTNFTDTGSTLTGAILTDFATSTAHVTLNADTWNMTGNSNMTSLTETGSTINFAPPAAGADVTVLSSYKTLTTNTFLGAGGEINMNTFLAADPSPSDRIVITALNGVPGTASADPVSLFFHNTGGPGAQTTMNGILVVQADEVGGTTQPGMFVLDNPQLRGGAYDYRLFRGSPIGDPTVANDWFLRSSFVVGPPEEPEPVHPIGPTPPPEPLPPGEWPIIGPELATYGVVQPIARQMGLATLGTYQDRVGKGLVVVVDLLAEDAAPYRLPAALVRDDSWRGLGDEAVIRGQVGIEAGRLARRVADAVMGGAERGEPHLASDRLHHAIGRKLRPDDRPEGLRRQHRRRRLGTNDMRRRRRRRHLRVLLRTRRLRLEDRAQEPAVFNHGIAGVDRPAAEQKIGMGAAANLAGGEREHVGLGGGRGGWIVDRIHHQDAVPEGQSPRG